jgi:hypothetical protein
MTRGGSRPGAGRPQGSKDRTPRKGTPAMVTTSLQVTPDQLAWLRRQAAAQGISIAEVLRRMIAREISNEA